MEDLAACSRQDGKDCLRSSSGRYARAATTGSADPGWLTPDSGSIGPGAIRTPAEHGRRSGCFGLAAAQHLQQFLVGADDPRLITAGEDRVPAGVMIEDAVP